MENKFKKRFIPFARKVALVAVGYFLFISFYLYFSQDNMIFLKPRISKDQLNSIRATYKDHPNVEELNLKTPDSTKLHGWFIKDSLNEASPLIIYFSGNYEDISLNIEEKRMYHDIYQGYSFALVNYRGYGESKGKPTEKNLYSDALFIYDYFKGRKDVDKNKIIVMGSSLGSAVATYLTAKRDVKGSILIAPFDSALNVARGLYPYLPVKLLLRHHFDAASFAKTLDTPMLMIATPDDEMIPFMHAEALFDAWGKDSDKDVKKELVLIPGRGHNTIAGSDNYWQGIKRFLKN